MSFTSFDRPRIGEIARCKRCRTTYVTKQCPCGAKDCGVVMLPVGHDESGIDEVIGARLIADRTSEFCPSCWTPDEHAALLMRERSQLAGKASN